MTGAVAEARRVIHDNAVDRLQQLVAEYPALLSWHADDEGVGLLGMATGAYGDAFDPEREKHFTRAASAEWLIDAGAVVTPAVCEALIRDRPRGLLQLFERKGVLPRTLKFRAALGDLDAVRASLNETGNDLATVNEAFMIACRFAHEAVASLLLDRAIALDAEFGTHVDGSGGRLAFIKYLSADRALAFVNDIPSGPWQVFIMERIMRALQDGDLDAFVRGLQQEPWLLGEAGLGFQEGLIGRAVLRDRGAFIAALFELDPAILRRRPPPRSQAIEFALTYAKPHLIPLLTRIWPLPDDLPHAAGVGDLARVKQWLDESKAATACSRFSTRRWPTPSSTSTSTSRTSSSSTARTSTRRGTPTSRRASCITWSSMAATSRCNT